MVNVPPSSTRMTLPAVGGNLAQAAAQRITVQVDGDVDVPVDVDVVTQCDVAHQLDVRAVGDGVVQLILRRDFGLRPRPLYNHTQRGEN